jgi:S-formylglutathione hydrolase FrmB
MADRPVKFQLIAERVGSRVLEGNLLGDPVERELLMIAPEDASEDASAHRDLPLVFVLAGYSGRGRSIVEDHPWSEGLLRRMDRLAREGRIGPMVAVLPDCFTRYGGSQYLNSTATGRYEDYLWQELLPEVRRRFSVGRIGIVGKSSGGYGAIVQAMRHPQIISAAASHSGDMYFEYCYLADFPKVARDLRRGGIDGFLARFDAAAKKREGAFMTTMDILAMAACYSPDEGQPHGFALPFDVETGEIRGEVWSRWLARDPVRMLDEPKHVEALRGLRLLHIECGNRDEFLLDAGARIFASRLRALGVTHDHEEFDDSHMEVQYRYDTSLPKLWRALAG